MKVYLLGAGPGDPGLLTIKAMNILRTADVVVYDALVNPALLDYVKDGAERCYVGKIAGNHALSQPEINDLLIQKARERGIVARLKGGDPYIFGRGGEEAQALLAANIPFEEVPGISSTIAAPAYAGIPLTHRDCVSQVTLITGHEKAEKAHSALNWKALVDGGGTLVFVMGMKNLPSIVENLLKAGLSPKTKAALIYRGTTPRQRSLAADIVDLPRLAEEAHFTNPSVIVVGEVVALHSELNWFEQKPLFGRTIVVTRAREQASSLVSALTERGAHVLECPTIRIAPCDPAPVTAAIRNLAAYTWFIVTSVNGVRLFWDALAANGLDSRALAGLTCCAIGPATAKALAERGIRADILPPRFVAESLVEEFLAHAKGKGGRVLLARAKGARDILPKALESAGFPTDVVPLYTTEPDCGNKEEVLDALRDMRLSCITFASSQTVKNFLAIVPKEEIKASDIPLAAIGPITAKTLTDAGLTCHIEPREYTIPALVSALTDYFATRKE